MKVFCRFAPSNGPAAAAFDSQSLDALPLLLRAEGQLLTSSASTASPTTTTTGTRVHLADPVTLSKAVFSCDGVFLTPGTAHDASALTREQQQQQEQLYACTCGCLLDAPSPTLARVPASFSSTAAALAAQGDVPRRIYLAYGQTASGKSYSLFGEAPSRRDKRDEPPSAAGVVPRYLYDVFRARASSSGSCPNSERACEGSARVFVDVSCVEVYNETITDLVALSTTMAAASMQRVSGVAAVPGSRASNGSGVHGGRHGAAYAHAAELQQKQAPVWAAHRRHRDEQEERGDDFSVRNSSISSPRNALASVSSQASLEEYGATRSDYSANNSMGMVNGDAPALPFTKTEYKATEKQQVLRCVERARCVSFAEAQAVLHALLSLRQACATSRNQSSSRGHLVFRVEAYASRPDSDGWASLQHETAFVDLAGSEGGRLTEADAPWKETLIPRAAAAGRHRRRGRSSGPISVNEGVAPKSRASSQRSHNSHDSSVCSTGSSRQSNCSNSHYSRDVASYHHYLLHPPLEDDGKALRARRLRETRCINASLLALRKVFRALHEATHLAHSYDASASNHSAALSRRPPLHHAPFKDSALTTILQPFLVPQAATPTETQQQQHSRTPRVRVVLLVCCSSRSADFYETVASLRLGAEATAVNPEVVLRALPVQRREQQQQQQQQQHANGSGTRRSQMTAAGSQPPFRSTSAPSGRLLRPSSAARQRDIGGSGSNDDDDDVDTAPSELLRRAESSSGHRVSGSTESAGGAQRSAATAVALAPSPADQVSGSGEVQRYKDTALVLYKQCKSLCESYDACVEELGRCRAALAEKDARIAALEARLAAAEKTSRCAAAHTSPPPPSPAPTGPPRGTEGSSSPAATSPQHSPPTGLSQQHQQQQCFYEMRRIARDTSTARRAAARLSRSRGVSSSTAREESARCMVSVSPFSTTSLMASAVAGGIAAATEAAVDDNAEGGSREQSVADYSKSPSSSPSQMRHAAGADPPTENAKASTADHKSLPGGPLQQARSIMHHLLSRQVFPPAGSSAAASPSPARDNSPSPVLPSLSAHNTATSTKTATLARDAAVQSKESAQRAVISAPLNLACPSCGSARSPASAHFGSSGATASSVTVSEEAKRSSSGERRGAAVEVVSWQELKLPSQDHQPLNGTAHRAATTSVSVAAAAAVGEALEVHSNSLPLEGSAPSSIQALALAQHSITPASPRNTTPAQAVAISMNESSEARSSGVECGAAREEEETQEIVISFRSSPAGCAASNSEGGTRRSKSTAYTALMPPSPSRSPASSRSPSFYALQPSTDGVYQL
ncbi:putative kinesin [Leptomonas seymouri]|uniref:Putative kinesin n=1 Tax=Leptomonas seymouri TaxID=5684 RepID=A0A0N0P5C2_LEPSE|nr:putative kinesin [Leptomonas seymouri]|eukprot:KPI86296.1 putative kinesin [Leptomonas seymouri]